MPKRQTHKAPVGSGGRKRAVVIDDNVTAMATGRRQSPGGSNPSPSSRRQPAQPSSFAPSGTPPKTSSFGTPIQEPGQARQASFAEENAARLRAEYSRPTQQPSNSATQQPSNTANAVSNGVTQQQINESNRAAAAVADSRSNRIR